MSTLHVRQQPDGRLVLLPHREPVELDAEGLGRLLATCVRLRAPASAELAERLPNRLARLFDVLHACRGVWLPIDDALAVAVYGHCWGSARHQQHAIVQQAYRLRERLRATPYRLESRGFTALRLVAAAEADT